MKYSELVRQGLSKMVKVGVVDADTDAWILLEKICNISKTDYFVKMHDSVADDLVKQYFAAIDRRITHYPLQYIIGEWEFMGLTFKVNEKVLIPRSDTETLVINALNIMEKEYKNVENIKVLDMCTGSGCIGISLAKICEKCNVLAIDVSREALAVASENAELNQVENIEFQKSDLFEIFDEMGEDRRFDIIISNPPYIPTSDIETLMPEVRDYEPRLALDGDEDGLKFYRRIVAGSKHFLKHGGYLMFEIGYNQAEAVKELMNTKYDNLEVIKDLGGNDRVVIGKRK